MVKFRRDRTDPHVNTLLLHPFELSLAALCILAGVGVAGSLDESTVIPVVLGALWAIGLVLGGSGVVVGLVWRGDEFVARSIEKASLYALTAVWGTVVPMLFVYLGIGGIFPAGQGVACLAGCIGRIVALRKVNRAIDQIQTVALRDEGEGDV